MFHFEATPAAACLASQRTVDKSSQAFQRLRYVVKAVPPSDSETLIMIAVHGIGCKSAAGVQVLHCHLWSDPKMRAQGHLHPMQPSMGGTYVPQTSLQPGMHHHQGHQIDQDGNYVQTDSQHQHLLHSSQHAPHNADRYHHPQVSNMYIQQQTAQPMLSDGGDQRHEIVALPFPQPSLGTYAQSAMDQHQHLEAGPPMGPSSGPGSDYPVTSPDGAMSPGDHLRK